MQGEGIIIIILLIQTHESSTNIADAGVDVFHSFSLFFFTCFVFCLYADGRAYWKKSRSV